MTGDVEEPTADDRADRLLNALQVTPEAGDETSVDVPPTTSTDLTPARGSSVIAVTVPVNPVTPVPMAPVASAIRPAPAPPSPTMTDTRSALLGGYLIAYVIFAALGLFALWPTAADAQAALGVRGGTQFRAPHLPVLHLRLTADVCTLLIAALGGMLGGSVHGLSVLSARAGYGDQGPGWALWYASAPLIGGAVAVLLYATIRGGLLTTGNAALSLYGVVALSGVAGLFSRAAMQRLAAILGSVSQPRQQAPTNTGAANGDA